MAGITVRAAIDSGETFTDVQMFDETGGRKSANTSACPANRTASKLSDLCLHAGDTIRIETSGGGGHGAPAERDPAAVAADIAKGYMTPAVAIDAYGDDAPGNDGNSRRRL